MAARPAKPFVFLCRQAQPHTAIDFGVVKLSAERRPVQARFALEGCWRIGPELLEELPRASRPSSATVSDAIHLGGNFR